MALGGIVSGDHRVSPHVGFGPERGQFLQILCVALIAGATVLHAWRRGLAGRSSDVGLGRRRFCDRGCEVCRDATAAQVCVRVPDGRILSATSGFAEMARRGERADVIGRPISDLLDLFGPQCGETDSQERKAGSRPQDPARQRTKPAGLLPQGVAKGSFGYRKPGKTGAKRGRELRISGQ